MGGRYTLDIPCSYLIIDSELGRIVIGVWAGAFEALADKLETDFPDEQERREFGEAVAADLANPAYRLFTWV